VKKLLGLCLALFLFIGMSFAQQTQTFNLKTTVQQYVEVNPAYVIVTPGTKTISGNDLVAVPGFPDYGWGRTDVAYANCPFSVSYAGSGGGVAFPILSKSEVPIGNGYDRLQTRILIKNRINGVWGAHETDFERHDMNFLSDPDGADIGTWTNQTVTFANAPHDGEIHVDLFFKGTLPHVSPDFGTNNTWNQSADAGLYECQLIATYTAL